MIPNLNLIVSFYELNFHYSISKLGEVISASEDNVTENFETEESHDVWSQAESGRVQCCFKPSRCVIL